MHLTSEDRSVLDRIAQDGGRIVDRAVDWCAINSGSRNLEGLERQRQILLDAAAGLPAAPLEIPLTPSREIDANGREAEFPHPPSVAVIVRPEAPVQVILTGHYDTVYPENSPFQAVSTRSDGALHGPGIADMKGGISVMLAALAAFETHPHAGNVGYRVLLSPDEEIGSIASGPILSEFARQGHVGLTYEPALADGALAAARKGSGNFHIVIHGRAAHAGRDFAAGRNAIVGAARIAEKLHALNGLRDGLTVNVARIDGGAPLNMVPDVAVVRFNVRFPEAAAAVWFEAEVARIVSEVDPDLHAHLHGLITRGAKPFNAAQQQLFGAVKAVGALLGQDITWKPSGGVCEGNNLFASGLPNVDTLGVRGGDIHSEAEHAWPESFVERAQLSASILMKLASGEIDARAIRAAMENA
ncbi:hydrolase [Caulobacter vibrioides]|uniref:hydrolase n=1 Tax=Caulobacter vibrioides TaxID=155892 RepID=UPI000BB51A60|nr:hydrolase [Caulobacter vibrioides]ATC24615.1 acetylornithine deacetylase [Caulobacter vibrioides]AZH12753.1 hydrolase [Caulobacter vibrioides]PLR09390.1 acetylornithine deacetylase [Caulobacter vibrioides]